MIERAVSIYKIHLCSTVQNELTPKQWKMIRRTPIATIESWIKFLLVLLFKVNIFNKKPDEPLGAGTRLNQFFSLILSGLDRLLVDWTIQPNKLG